MPAKSDLRNKLRAARRKHVASLDPRVRALLLMRPPHSVSDAVPAGAVVGAYAETSAEAPASGYARWFAEQGHTVALPWFAARDEAMTFRQWENPHDVATLERGPWGMLQPPAEAEELVPDVLFVPLVGFTASGARLGMGAGHYDRWLEAHPTARAIGLAWDCQEVTVLPLEPHDRMLEAIITPTRHIAAASAQAGS